MLPIAILAGGLATRLRPVTETIPKALIEVAGEPFLAHQLRLLRRHGFERVVLCVGYLGEQIQAFAGDGRAFGLQVEYSFDGPQLLGTAGALRRALPMLGDAFAVIYGDSYLPCDYAGGAGGVPRFGQARPDDGVPQRGSVGHAATWSLPADAFWLTIRRIVRPPCAISITGWALSSAAPSTMCRPAGLTTWPRFIRDLLRRGELAAWESPERFYEIGSVEGIDDLAEFLKS